MNWVYVMLMDPTTSRRMESRISLDQDPERWLKINRTDHPEEEPIDHYRVGVDAERGEAYFIVGKWLRPEVIGKSSSGPTLEA